jgi:deoxyadenosine/deoxycytidine kinase
MKKQIIVVAGNIGSGKTTLAERLASEFNWCNETEPVTDNPYLEDFYRDMRTWALHTQIHFLSIRATQHQKASNAQTTTLLERSIYEDANVFAMALHQLGFMSSRDFRSYQRLFNVLASHLKHPHLILYLRAPINVLLQRVCDRGRPFERNVSAEYLGVLDTLYDQWIGSIHICPVITIDSATSTFADARSINAIGKQILRAIDA